MNDKERLLRHFLAALAYRTQKALRGAPTGFGSFSAGHGIRTPAQLVCHMTSVLGYARTFFVGGQYWPDHLLTLEEEISRFHEMIQDLAHHLEAGATLLDGMTAERLLQGPLSDALTHAGQLAMLRRLAGAPVAPENFVRAEIDPERLGPDQPDPVSPDKIWPEAPAGWRPPIMPIEFEHSVVCSVSRDFAWKFWTNVENWAIVDPSVEWVRLDGPFVSGTTGHTKSRDFPETEWKLLEVESGRCAVIELNLPQAVFSFRWLFDESADGGTRITRRMTLEGERATITLK